MPAQRYVYKNPMRVTIMLEATTYEAFRLWCHNRRRSVSQVIGKLLEKVLEENPEILKEYEETPEERRSRSRGKEEGIPVKVVPSFKNLGKTAEDGEELPDLQDLEDLISSTPIV